MPQAHENSSTPTDRGGIRPLSDLAQDPHRIDKVIATADETLRFEHGIEHATEEALSDPEHLAALIGLEVWLDDGVVGTCFEAHWDAPRRQLVADLLVDDLADMERIKMGEVSEVYTASVDEDGRQTARIPHQLMVGPTRRIASGVTDG